MTPGESLAAWVLVLEQGSYVSYKKRWYKDIASYRTISLLNLDYKIDTATLNNWMQKTLDTIVGENQSAAIKNRTI